MRPAILPAIRLPAAHRPMLARIAEQAVEDGHPVAGFLLAEIGRAELCEHTPGIVTLNDWVTYRLDWGFPAESRMLVAPEDYRNPAIHLSVLSPPGAALLGLGVGGRMPYREIDGTLHVVTVESLDPPIGLMSLLNFRRARDNPTGSAPDDDPGPTAA